MQSTEISEVQAYGHPDEAVCWVYEVYAGSQLVYVGIADNFERRWYQHSRKSWWLGEVQVENVQVLGFASRADARMVEAVQINERSPVYNTNAEAPSYQRWKQTGSNHIPYVARRWFRPTGWDSIPVSENRTLSLAAVGMWYRAMSTLGVRFVSADLAKIHPDPDAWGPFNDEHDLEGPLSELQALGYAREVDGWIELSEMGCA